MNNLLVIGGFTESKRLLEPVASEAICAGFGHDAEVLTLRNAMKMDDERLRSLIAGANVITHSAGITAVPDVRTRTSDAELPEELVVIAGPEPRQVSQLVGSANRKTYDHLFGKTIHPRKAHRRIVAGNAAELIAHPYANFSLIPDISRFSTMDHLGGKRAAASGRLGNFMMSNDVFFRIPDWQTIFTLQELQHGGGVVGELPGSHDELLLNPMGVLGRVKAAFMEKQESRAFEVDR